MVVQCVRIELSDQSGFQFAGELSLPLLDVILAPGEGVFIPAFYFHHVEVKEMLFFCALV